jgi:cytochrome P450
MPLIARVKALRRLHTGPEEIRDAGGPVTLVRLGPRRLVAPMAVITSPQGAHDVLGGSDGSFDKEMITFVEARKWFGNNLFNITHEPWVSRRRTMQPLFTKKHVAIYAGRMADIAQTSAATWARAGSIDLDKETRRLTMRVLGQSLFGLDLGAQAEELGPPLNRAVQFVTDRSLQPVRAPAWLPTFARHRFRTAKDVVDRTIDDAITAARGGPGRNAELIRLFFETTDPVTGKRFTDRAIRQELWAFLFAGHDTTATTLAYSLWALGRDGAIQERVAAESAALGDRPLQVDDVAHLPYTVQVIHEALRMCPPAAVLARMAMRDVVVDGYRIPAGTNVVVGVYALHHDPTLWVDPGRFDPERFRPDRSAGRNRWQYLPFGGGPRTCIGDHFAMLEATLALAGILRTVQTESLCVDFPLVTPFTTVAGGPVPARIRARTSAPPV